MDADSIIKGFPHTVDKKGRIFLFPNKIVLTKTEYEALAQKYEIKLFPGASCGYGWLDIKEKGNKVVIELTPCWCHWNHYYIMFEARDNE